jgi:hypothetical protein
METTTIAPASTTMRRITLITLIVGTLAALGMIFVITPGSLLMMISGPSGSGEPSFGTNLIGYVGMAYAPIAIIAPIAAWVMFFRRAYRWALGLVLAPLLWFILWLISFGIAVSTGT